MRHIAWFVLIGAGLVGAIVLGAGWALGPLPERAADTNLLVDRAASPTSPRPVPPFSAGYADDGGFNFAQRFIAPIADRRDLDASYLAHDGAGERGVIQLQREDEGLRASTLPADERDHLRAGVHVRMGILRMYDGEFEAARTLFAQAEALFGTAHPEERANAIALQGIAAMRRGEVENCVACVGPSSCLFPIAPEAVHQFPDGSENAIDLFTEYLARRPDDLGIRWLLNLTSMTVGGYPARVPEEHRIAMESFGQAPSPVRFTNVALTTGLDARGPNMFGGSVFDDFTGDGRPDVFVASHDWDRGASLFVNRRDGTFEDRGESWGLAGQRMSENCVHADYDDDGRLDVLLLRGGWQAPFRMSLLCNTGTGFEDVTASAGLDEPIATQSAVWGDFDGDGDLDLFVGGEFQKAPFDARNRSRLYRNEGDGTFVDVAGRAGVENERWAKGVAAGDYDGDGDLDLYVSNRDSANRLYRNEGNGRFQDVAVRLGVDEPLKSFSCWFWDYDNDGRLDLFVTGYGAWLNGVVASQLGQPAEGERPRLYRNVGPDGFRDVTKEVGLDRVWLPMGSNVADFDNDGWLDIYFATGLPPYSHLMPNILLRNVEGRRFEDVTVSSGTGHLQKGHGVSCADYDADGDLDLFVQMGGASLGDRAHNVLFQNGGAPGRWLALKLVGSQSNRSALGATVRADVRTKAGAVRSLYRTVGPGSSFGGNSLVVWLGLGDAERVENLAIRWPRGGELHELRDVAVNQLLTITESLEQARSLQAASGAAPD